MSQLKVNAIRGTGASSDAISVNSTDGTCTAKITNNLSNRRINENGACVIAQRGTSSTSTEYQTVDRWRSTFNQVSVTQTQHALTDADTGPWEKGFRYSYHLENTSTSSATNAWTEFGTRIEAQNICNSGWVHSSTSSYLTYSFWAKSSLAGTYYTWLRSKDSTNKVYASSFVLAANTWKKVSFTVPGASNVFINNDNGVGLNVNISPYWGTDYTDSGTGTGSWVTFVSSTRLPNYAQNWCNTANATFEATGLQLEAGDVATDFEHRSYGDELARCQRYYEVLYMSSGTACCYSSGDATIKYAHTWYFKHEKRAQASVALLGNAAFSVSGGGAITLTGIFTSKEHVMFYYDSGMFRLGDGNQDASVKAESEL